MDYDENFYKTISWAHQCWQLYKLGNDIDYEEFKRRLDIPNVDFRKFMEDYQELLDKSPENEKLYIQRIIDCLIEQGE
jgi:hypothetical protein